MNTPTNPTPSAAENAPTPRTDAAVTLNKLIGGLPGELHPSFADFARTLERELQSAQAELAQAKAELDGRKHQLDMWASAAMDGNAAIAQAKARAEKAESKLAATKAALAEAVKDKERLDWLLANAYGLTEGIARDATINEPIALVHVIKFHSGQAYLGLNRAMIDAARAEQEGGGHE